MKKELSCVICLLFVVLYALWFVWGHGHIVLNRYTDSWWHIAAADEYARTGVFAKDPFIQNAPPFAPFGLEEFVNSRLSLMTGFTTRDIFVFLTALNVVIFLLASFASGYILNRSFTEGLVCAFTGFVVFGQGDVISLGLPFVTALSLFFLLLVSFLVRDNYSRISWRGMFLRGVSLAVIFDLHAFAGLIGGVVLILAFVADFLRSMRHVSRETRKEEARLFLLKGLVFLMAFVVLAWPWIELHAALYGYVCEINCVRGAEQGVGFPGVWVLLSGMLMSILFFGKWGSKSGGKSIVISCFVLGVLLLLLNIPYISRFVANHTSEIMVARLHLFFPFGIVFALAYRRVVKVFVKSTGVWDVVALVLVGGIFLLLIVLPMCRQALTHHYLLTAHDYDRHEHGHLEEVCATNWNGKTILSDPMTSYYLRGMTGAYAVTVPWGHASPVLDYARLDDIARKALAGGPKYLGDVKVDAVLVNKKNRETELFAGKRAGEIVDAWKTAGWTVGKVTKDLVLIRPAVNL